MALIEPHAAIPQPVTLGADKGYDSAHFVRELREEAVTPHVAQNTSGRRSVISG
jgi:IS5 family transposase